MKDLLYGPPFDIFLFPPGQGLCNRFHEYDTTLCTSGNHCIADTRKCCGKPFFTTREMGRGTGLGLASTYGILSSGFSIDGQATEILERGCNGFVQKPSNMNELSRKIREILD